jgi:RNA polymerase sigma factor (sigma-70 family)
VDADDWTQALAGDGEAFGRVFDRHRDRVRRHAHGLVPVAADAEDVVAVTFLEAWRSRARVRLIDGSALPWLLVTATNTANNVRRAAARYRRLLDRLPAADEVVIDDDDLAATRALANLSLDDRRVLTLCVLYDYRDAEAAALLGIPLGTLKSRLSRAKARLTTEFTLTTTSRSTT